jgi:hypothetical protein
MTKSEMAKDPEHKCSGFLFIDEQQTAKTSSPF